MVESPFKGRSKDWAWRLPVVRIGESEEEPAEGDLQEAREVAGEWDILEVTWVLQDERTDYVK